MSRKNAGLLATGLLAYQRGEDSVEAQMGAFRQAELLNLQVQKLTTKPRKK